MGGCRDTNHPMNPNSDPPATLSGTHAGHGRRKRWLVLVLVGLAVLAGTAWLAGKRSINGAQTAPAPVPMTGAQRRGAPVVALAARKGNLDIYLPALGTVTPLNTVQIHSRVDGQLMSIAFKEGQTIEQGELLALIDPKPFEVQLGLVTGQLARNEALLEGAQVDLERYRSLLAQDSIARQQVETQESLVRQYKAAVQAARGEVENAQLQLAHTRITAPISGRVGFRQVGPGSIVRAAGTSPIVVITQLNPISVVFPIPEDALPRVMTRLNAGERIQVDAFDRDQKAKLAGGRLLAADNQIDPATGTVKLRAEFRNTDGALFANQFVNVRMLIETRRDALLVPTAAIQRGAAGTFVYVVKDDKTVTAAPVTVGSTQGEISVIDAGVAAGAMVVTDGADGLRDGMAVELTVREPAAALESSTERRAPPGDVETPTLRPKSRSARSGA